MSSECFAQAAIKSPDIAHSALQARARVAFGPYVRTAVDGIDPRCRSHSDALPRARQYCTVAPVGLP